MKTILDTNLYDVNETANLLGISPVTTRNYFKDGTIRAKKIGKSWYASDHDIKEYLNADKSEKQEPTNPLYVGKGIINNSK